MVSSAITVLLLPCGFADAVREKQGWVTNNDLATVRSKGWSDAEVMETATNTLCSIFQNSCLHIAGTTVDFPAAPPLSEETA